MASDSDFPVYLGCKNDGGNTSFQGIGLMICFEDILSDGVFVKYCVVWFVRA